MMSRHNFTRRTVLFENRKCRSLRKAHLDELLARESDQLHEQKIHKIPAAMEVQVYMPRTLTTSKRRQFQLPLNRAREAVTTWSDAEWQSAIEPLECEIHQVTPVKHKLFAKLFQHHIRQLLQDVWTKATGPKSTYAKKLDQLKMLQKKRFKEGQTWPSTSVWNFRSIYLMLRPRHILEYRWYGPH
jgi:hypothetical protein